MRKVFFLFTILIAAGICQSFKSVSQNSRAKYTYDANIDGTDYWINSSDVYYDADGDVNETPITGWDAGRGQFISVEICPGKGAHCQVVLTLGPHNTIVVVGYKTPGGPDILIS